MEEQQKQSKSIKEQRFEVDQELTDFDLRMTERMGNIQSGLNSDTLTKEEADRDTEQVLNARNQILERRKTLGVEVEVGGQRFVSENFNEKGGFDFEAFNGANQFDQSEDVDMKDFNQISIQIDLPHDFNQASIPKEPENEPDISI